MAIEKDAAEAAEFSALLAELEADQGDNSEEAAPEAEEVVSDPEADEESEETEEELVDAPEASASLDEVRDLIEGGDLKAACEKLGLDPGIFKINNRQFAAVRKGAAESKRVKAEADAALNQGTQLKAQGEDLHRRAEEVYGPIVAGRNAYKAGDPLKARAAIELFFEDSLENVVATMARHAKGLDPAQVEVLKLRRELAEKDAKQTAAQAAAAAQAEDASQVTAISGKLKGTPLEGVDGAAAEIYAVLKASTHPTLGTYTKTLKEAFIEVRDAKAKAAAQLARLMPGHRPAPKAVESRRPLDRTPLAPKRTAPRVDPDAEFRAAVKEAGEAADRAARKSRRVK
jgi:hypothetical protein